MKKNYIFYVCAAAALMFASCQKEGPASEGNDVSSTGVEVITATAMPTKTITQDGVNVLWENGDKISLFSLVPNADNPEKPTAVLCDYITALDAPNANATFIKDATDENQPCLANGKYAAFYAKGASNTTRSRSFNVSFTLDKEQKAKNGGDFAASFMAATSENTDFRFEHMASYIKFTVDANTTPFKRLTVSSVDDSKYMVARIYVYFDESDMRMEVVTGNSQSSKTVSVTTDDNAAFAPGTYYMAINPDTYAEGLNLTFENESSEVTLVSPANVVMAPGDVADLGTIGTLNFTVSKLRTVYAENGVNQGVVFWTDPADPSKAKIISGAVTNVAWGPAKDLDETLIEYLCSHTSAENHEYVKQFDGYSEANYPAVYFCDNLPGEGWHLPSYDDLKGLLKVYWGLDELVDGTNYNTADYSASMNVFDAALAQCVENDPDTAYDETKINVGITDANVTYWSGEGRSEALPNSRLWRVFVSKTYNSVSYGNPTSVHYVRCVREVELQ